MKVLIIEDEPLAQTEIKRLLKQANPNIEVLACIDSVEESVEWLQSNSPELIFMDIQLSDGQSFDIFTEVEVKCPVVFTTAYDAYAIKAFQVNSIDYLLKPIEPEGIKKALEKYANLKTNFGTAKTTLSEEQIREIARIGHQGYKSRFMTSIGDRIKFVTEDQVCFFRAEDDLVFLITPDKKKYIVNYTLENLEPLLDPKQFFRINRRYIARISAIGDIHKYFNSRLKVQLNPDPGDEVLVSRVKVPQFLQWIEK